VKVKEGYTGKYTLHAFERLPNGRTMVAESGNQRIIEVDTDGKIVHEIPLAVDKPSATSDTRMVRSVPGGATSLRMKRTARFASTTGTARWSGNTRFS
jgi:hypothetical protein